MVELYQDRSNSVENRVEDLLVRLTLQDKAGLMFHDIITMMPGGQLIGADNPFGRPVTEAAHFPVGPAAAWRRPTLRVRP